MRKCREWVCHRIKVGAEMGKGGWGRNELVELGEVTPKRDRKKKIDRSRKGRYHKILNNNLNIHINVQKKSLCQIEYLLTKSLFKKICFETWFKSWKRFYSFEVEWYVVTQSWCSLVKTVVIIALCSGGRYLENMMEHTVSNKLEPIHEEHIEDTLFDILLEAV